jgi:hypothetical protein
MQDLENINGDLLKNPTMRFLAGDLSCVDFVTNAN